MNNSKNSPYKNGNGALNSRGRMLRERLVRKGVSLREIAEKLGIKRQAVDYFIRNNWIEENWKKSNEYFLRNRTKVEEEKKAPEKQRRMALEVLASQVNEVLLKRLNEASPIERKSYDLAVEYLGNYPKEYSFSFLFDFYNHVNSLIENDKKFSYNNVAEKFGLHSPSARRLLVAVGLKSSNKPLLKKTISEEQKLAIRRGLDKTNWSYADLAYFAKVSNVTIRAIHVSRSNGRIANPEDMFFADFGCKGKLTLRRASQIYQLLDKGVPLDRIQKRLKIGEQVLSEAVANRSKYSQELVDDLRKMYPEKEITRPYLN